MSRALRSQVRELQRRIRELEAELKDVDAKMMQKRNKGGGLVASSPRPKVIATPPFMHTVIYPYLILLSFGPSSS